MDEESRTPPLPPLFPEDDYTPPIKSDSSEQKVIKKCTKKIKKRTSKFLKFPGTPSPAIYYFFFNF